MADTPRTLAALQALLADNSTAQISAQDVRDFLVSVFPQTTKGDLPYIDPTGILTRLPATTDGFILTLDATTDAGWKWASAGGHTEDHDHDGAPTQKLLAANTHESPSADTHHAKSHVHDGADGSGTVAHSATTGRTANDHHSQSHGNADHATAFTDDTTVNAHITDASDAHDASAVSILDTAAQFAATNVEDALAEVLDAEQAHEAAADPHTGYRLESVALYSYAEYVFMPDAAPTVVVTAGDQQGVILHSGPAAETAVRLYVDAETAPGAAGLPVTVQYADTDDLDTAVTWTTIATLTLSSAMSDFTDTMTNATIPANRLLRLNVGSPIVGSPADVSISLRVKRPISV